MYHTTPHNMIQSHRIASRTIQRGIHSCSHTQSLRAASTSISYTRSLPHRTQIPFTPRHRHRTFTQSHKTCTPTTKYDEMVQAKTLRDDQHQRSIIKILQNLHDQLASYDPPKVEKVLGVKQQHSTGFFGRLFGGGHSKEEDGDSLRIPSDTPKGLYLFGDVGTGKRRVPPYRIDIHTFLRLTHSCIG